MLLTVGERNAPLAPRRENEDRHVLQIAFDLGASSIAQPAKDTILWSSATILKDNETRDYTAAEIVSIIGGKSVAVLQPATVKRKSSFLPESSVKNELDLKPRGKGDCCKRGANSGLDTRSIPITISDLPFDYAVPMLNGWDLGTEKDHHLSAAGAWIDSFKIEKNAATKKTTLKLTLKGGIQDKDENDADLARFELAVLGIQRVGIVADPTPTPIGPTPKPIVPTPTPIVPTCNGKPATIIGSAGDDDLTGTFNDDVIVGLAGNDRISARPGNDTICGNEGFDTLDGEAGTDFCDGGIGTNSFTSCETQQ